jgi:IS30 family transposase
MSGIAMGTQYDHFTLEERCRLRGLMEMGLGAGEIARRLGRHRGSIYREITRNRCVDEYRPDSADRMAWVRKLRGSKIQRSTHLGDYVGDRLAMGWSPEQIAGRMELDTMNDAISAESIYRYVYSPVGRRAGLPRYLAQRKARRGRRRRNGRREPSIPNRTSIDQRPTEADGRIAFGHWEGDLMHFRRQKDILLTLQERCSRLTLAGRLHSKDATDTADAIIDKLASLPSTAVQTITHDNGGEFARHERVRNAIGLRAFLLRSA